MDGGKSWTAIQPDQLPAGNGDLQAVSEQVLFFLANPPSDHPDVPHSLYRSTDGGAHWTKLSFN